MAAALQSASPLALPSFGLSLSTTNVLITGAAGAIGRSVTLHFLAAGSRVFATDISAAGLTSLSASLSATVPSLPSTARLSTHTLDITDEVAMDALFSDLATTHGAISTVVALASLDLSYIPHHTNLADMPLAQWSRTLHNNATGTFLTARAWLRGLREHSTPETPNLSLVIIGSEAAAMGVVGNADYAAGKSAVSQGLLLSLAPEAARVHPRARVNVVAPGAVDTAQFREECSVGNGSSVRWRESEATVARGSAVSVEEVARVVVFLASEAWSGGVDGEVVRVDGGKGGKVFWLEGEVEARDRGA